MRDYFLWTSLAINVVLALIVWNDRFRWRDVIKEYENEKKTTDAVKKAAYNPKEFRQEREPGPYDPSRDIRKEGRTDNHW